MDTTIKALQNLYVALGGDVDNVADLTIIPDMINAIAVLITSGATNELPTVTTSNNGQALIVSSGKWQNADIPSQLPAVTSEDNGSVLKVVDGVWAVGTDLVE